MSPLEEKLLDQILKAGLPAPRTEFSFTSRNLFTRHRPPRPRAWRFDFCWPLYRVCVECDGGTWLGRFGGHTSGKGVEANREKDAEALREGWTVLRVTKQMVESGYALTVIRDLIAQRKQRLRREIGVYGREEAE
jgi:very-short-patch-repair endonuclease